LYSTTAIEVLGEHDLDFLFMDFEHNGPSVWDSLTIQEFVRAAEHADVELVVRIPSAVDGDHGPMIRKVLNTGVRNVVLRRVKTSEEVEAAVEASRFEYESGPGERGLGTARGSRWGYNVGIDWIKREDSTVLCGIMVETEEAVENIEDIVSVPGLGFVFIGSMDLSIALGTPIETENTRFTYN
jgi:2-dehydro-3-deoxyglucarate aldolase